MKRLICVLSLALIAISAWADYPSRIFIDEQDRHVQGIAYDNVKNHLFLSFTTSFVIANHEGEIIGSVDKIHGHLGAMTFDKENRKVYASLEEKNDAIGRSISKGLGASFYTESNFYIVEFDVDAIKGRNVPFEKVAKKIKVNEVLKDYQDSVQVDGKWLKHRFGCSGMDGMCVAPEFGKVGGKNYLYVAYGIYSDTLRHDNDYQVILRYQLKDIRKGLAKNPERYFVMTGNTDWGVQNMAYDSENHQILLCVYHGWKSQYPNYDVFSIDMHEKPFKAQLERVPYIKGKQKQMSVKKAWFFKHGSTGICQVEKNLWYIAISARVIDPQTGKKRYSSDNILYRWTGEETPFVEVGQK
ncbi:MAG: hypothetical protein IIX64_05875 [Bacteroidales bacterium]|nr:hypothetical protein [Bacteroidales bacterium]